MANKDKLYNKRYKTLAEHRAAVKARKLLQGGKNKGPVANADAYGSTLKKKAPSKAPTSAPKPSKPAAKPTSTKSNKERAASRFYSSSSQGSIANKEKAKARFFAGAEGGKYDKPEKKQHKGGARATVKKRTSSPKPKVTGKNRFQRRRRGM